jgi:biotin carboxyl carrier protein
MGFRRFKEEIFVSEHKQFCEIALENGVFETHVTRKFALRKPYEKQDPRVVKAVIPGVISEILTKTGEAVKQGDTIMIVEAMKMLNRIMAPLHGTIKAVHVSPGEKVIKGQVLLEIESADLLMKENRPRAR